MMLRIKRKIILVSNQFEAEEIDPAMKALSVLLSSFITPLRRFMLSIIAFIINNFSVSCENELSSNGIKFMDSHLHRVSLKAYDGFQLMSEN